MPQDIESIKAEVSAAVDTAATIGRVIAPQYTAFIVLGQALAKALPGIYEDVLKLIAREKPTDDELADLAGKLHALANPETI